MDLTAILEGRSILVTRGTNGIGRATALSAAEAGAAVTVNDIDDERGLRYPTKSGALEGPEVPLREAG